MIGGNALERALEGPVLERLDARARPADEVVVMVAAVREDALEARDAEHGASVHFVTAELDGGPVVLQSRVPVHATDTEADLSARVQATEHIIYPRVIGLVADGRLSWDEGRVRLDDKLLDAPLVERPSATPERH